MEKGVAELRKILSPALSGSRHGVLGQVEAMGVTISRDYAPAPKANTAGNHGNKKSEGWQPGQSMCCYFMAS